MEKIFDKYIELRKVGGSLYLRVPAGFIRTNGLTDGDLMLFEPEKFKFIKKSAIPQLEEEVAMGE
jgi:hypothetical protein